MAAGKKSKLTRIFFYNLIAGTILSFLLLGYLWIAWEYDQFDRASENMRSEFMAAQKDRLKGEIENIVEFIEFKKSQIERRLKDDIRNRAYEACQIALNIYARNRDTSTDLQIQKMIKDALRPIRFNNERGYYFAVSLDGVEQLYPVMPQLEGKNLLDLQDSKGNYVIRREIEIVRQSGEGFITDYWPKPDEDPALAFPKISFVKYFPPLDWYIGTGEYLDDVEKDIQDEVLAWIGNVRISQQGYAFAGRWDGVSLSGPAVGRNMLNVTDVNGVKIVQELIQAAKQGSGFVEYVMPKLEDKRSAPKISYAVGIPDWQWYVGGGVYVDEIDGVIAEERRSLKEGMRREIIKISLALIAALALITLAARYWSVKIDRSLQALILFFDKAAGESTPIDPNDLAFNEFASLAAAANTMVEQRLLAEAALRESREQWRAIVDNANLGVYQVTTEGRFIFVNPRMSEMFGYGSPEEMMAQMPNIARLYMNPEERDQNLKTFFEIGAIKDKLVKFRHKDGRAIWVQVNARITEEPPGAGMIEGFLLDVTERVEFEQALRESEERYRSLVEMSPEAVLLHQNGIIVYINRQGARLLGAEDPGAVIDKPVLDIIHPEHREIVQQRLTEIYVNQKQLPRMEQQYLRLDGTIIDVEATGNYIVYAGQAAGLSVIRDISADKLAARQKRKLESKLHQAQKMEAIGTLAGGIAHDFNNLLMGIQGRTSMMAHDLPAGHSYREHLREIEKYVRSATDLTKQLLGFARGGKYEVKSTDMNVLLSQSSDMFGRTRKDIAIHRRLQENIWSVDVDRSQIEQVLLNLYVNAWQAMTGPGELSLETENVLLDERFVEPYAITPGRYVRVSVADTGHGMPPETQLRIFEPFFTTKELGRGTGLGLASAYGIIKNHGGIITVSSAIGQGTTFTIYIPATDNPVQKEEVDTSEIAEGSGTILIIDDEHIILDVGREMLQRLGYSVLTADSGLQGLAVYETHRDNIVLVILDMIMPGMEGGEVYDRLRAIDPEVKVLLSSGYSLDGQAERILKRGCNGFVQKPFNLAQLSSTVRDILIDAGSESHGKT